MKKSHLLISLVSLMAISSAVILGLSKERENRPQKADASVGNYSTNPSTYYNGITATSGKQLAGQLHDLITSTHKTYTTYADNGANLYQANTDQYYENGNKVTGYIYEFYSGAKWSSSWVPNSTGGYNREHCWCQSLSNGLWGEDGGGADMHHLRPVEKDLNSTRNNNLYGTVTNRDSYKKYPKMSNGSYSSSLGGYCSGGVFEPIDEKKGDVARIILYCYLHYNTYSNSIFGGNASTNGNGSSSYFGSLPLTNVISASNESAALSLMLQWNTSDPVDEIEQRRNEQVAIYQGNRNPFIDNSGYADAIWGSGSTTPAVNSVTVTPSTASLNLTDNTTKQLTASVSVTGGAAQTVSWTSNKTSVATVSSSGLVTAKGEGSATITATSTVDSTKKGTCTVTITSAVVPPVEEDYTRLTSIANIDETAQYVLGLDGTGFHYSGTTSWGSVALPSAQTPLYYTLTKGNNNTSFTAKTTISDTLYYLTVPTSNTFTMSTSSTNIKLGTSTSDSDGDPDYAVTNTSTTGRHLRINGTNGLRSYSGTTGTMAYFYKVNNSTPATKTLSSITLDTSSVTKTFNVGDTFSYSGLVVTAHYSDNSTATVTPSSVSSPDMSTSGNKTITVTYIEGGVTKTATYSITVNEVIYSGDVYERITNGVKVGDEIIVVKQDNASATSGYAMNSTILSYYYLACDTVSISNNQITVTDEMTTWTVGGTSGAYTLYNGEKYLRGYVSGNYYDLGLVTDTSTSGITWSITASSSGYALKSSDNTYLSYKTYNSTPEFAGASSSYTLYLYRKVVTAESFAETFLSNLTCDSTGNSAPTLAISWSDLSTLYSSISSTSEKNLLKSATYTVNNSVVTPKGDTTQTIANAMSKYDIIVGKYSYNDFISRKGTSAYGYASPLTHTIFKNNSNTPVILVVISIIALTSIGGYFYLKRKKFDK